MVRRVASYRIDGHDVEVVEVLDEDGCWFEVLVDGAVVPIDDPLGAAPGPDSVAVLVRGWLHAPSGDGDLT